MTKKYHHTEEITPKVCEPVVAYNARSPHCSTEKQLSKHESVMSTTMSVDDYFGKLVSLVREDYTKSQQYGSVN